MMFSIIFLLVVLVNNSHADIQYTGSQMVVKQVKILTCTSDLNYTGHMAYQEWNQVYVGESGSETVISHLNPLHALKTMLTVELEKFDNNTDIYSSLTVHNASNAYKPAISFTMHCSGTDRKLISLIDDGFYQYKIDSTLTYDETKSVKFSCQEKVRTVGVAWINSAGDRIFPYNEPVITLNATKMHNASMLCCLYYTVTAEQDVKKLRRFVKNKTLLIYGKKMVNNGVLPRGIPNYKTSKDIRNSNITNETGIDLSTTINGHGKDLSTTINETAQNPNITNAPDKNSSGSTTSTDSNDYVSDTQTTTYVIVIISSISALVLILLISIVAIKTLYWKKNDRLERPRAPCQLPPNESASHMPFYVNLLFRRECDQEIRVREEPQYEEIMYQ